MNAPFATALAGWKASAKNKLAWPLVPNAADVDSAESMRIAAGVLDALGVARNVTSDVPKDPGGPLEQAVCDHLRGRCRVPRPACYAAGVFRARCPGVRAESARRRALEETWGMLACLEGSPGSQAFPGGS